MKKNTLTKEYIDKIVHSSKFSWSTQFGKCTVVTMQLPNGFVLTESSACVDPANYNEKLGYEICVKKLTERVWELEGYLLQNALYKKSLPERNFDELTIGELIELGFNLEVEVGTLDNVKRIKVSKGRI